MDPWVDVIYEKIIAAAKQDGEYQQLLAQCAEAEREYQQVLTRLPEGDAQLLEDYISSCEEMDHRLLRIAWELGKNHQE